MLIVYPDGDPQLISLIDGEMLSDLKKTAHFRVYEGKPADSREYIERVGEADGVLLGWGIPNEVFAACPGLKIVAFMGIGAANFVDLDFATSRGVAVANTPGYGDNAVAEHALALLLAVARNIPENHSRVSRGIWDQTKQGIEISGKTIGLVGLGGIGRRMAAICSAMGLKVICWTHRPSPERAREAGVTFVELETLLRQSDFISLHLNYNRQTRGFIGRQQLALMKTGAILINTGRAELVDTGALAESLASGHLFGAGIDVFDQEPVTANDPLLKLPNVVLSPHIGFNTPEASRNIISIALSNLVGFFAGRPVNILNPEAIK